MYLEHHYTAFLFVCHSSHNRLVCVCFLWQSLQIVNARSPQEVSTRISLFKFREKNRPARIVFRKCLALFNYTVELCCQLENVKLNAVKQFGEVCSVSVSGRSRWRRRRRRWRELWQRQVVARFGYVNTATVCWVSGCHRRLCLRAAAALNRVQPATMSHCWRFTVVL